MGCISLPLKTPGNIVLVARHCECTLGGEYFCIPKNIMNFGLGHSYITWKQFGYLAGAFKLFR